MVLAHVPQFFGGGIAFGAQVVAELVLAVEAVELSEIELGIVVFDKGVPVTPIGEHAQPAQDHPVGLRQVTIFGQECLDLAIAGAVEASGEFVVSQIRLERVVGQCRAIAQIGA